MSRLRVLHLGKFYPPVKGGMETVLESLCVSGAPTVDTRALVMNRSRTTTHEVVDDVAVTRVGSWLGAGSVSVAPALPLWLARATADLLVLHEPNPMALLAYFIARPRTRLIVWYHADVVRPAWRYRLFYRPLLQFALRRAERVVISSPPMRESPALAAHRSKCVVIPYGLDGERYRTSCVVAARAETLRERAGRPILLFVGRLVPYKGLDVLLHALPGLDAQVAIVGDGPLGAELRLTARSLGLGNRVRFVGEVSETERLAWLHACAALVLPSTTRQEAFGVVQLEAMLCARPVVSTDVPTGVPWVNVHSETGLVVRAGDAASLRRALQRLIADHQLRRNLGVAARARAEALFTAERMRASTAELFHQVSRRAVIRQADAPGPAAKRVFDVALAASGLMMSAPLGLLFAAAIKLQDGGPIFFRQERSGVFGRRFDVLKFRSMIPDAEANVGAVQASRSDPRITPVGRFLRATAMDELPQLWNILRGDMSFVGPRALRPGEVEVRGTRGLERLEDVPGFVERSQVRPGLTGIAQIYAPRDLPRRHKFRYDLLYVRRRSLWLDVRLVLLSVRITFRGAWGAVRSGARLSSVGNR